MAGTFNYICNVNTSYNYYKVLIEARKATINYFMDLYIYDEDEENDKFNLLLEYIIYYQNDRHIRLERNWCIITLMIMIN